MNNNNLESAPSADFFTALWQSLLTWLQASPDLFGLPYARYAAVLVTALLLLWLSVYLLKLFKLYSLALLTPKAHFAQIVSHVDGDTVRVKRRGGSDYPVRLIGVDTPESRRSRFMKIAPMGKEAAQFTKRYLPKNSKVILLYDREPNDKFDRQRVYLYRRNGELFNATLVKKGYAWAIRYEPNTRHAPYFEKLERKARRRKRGIWQVYEERNQLSAAYKRTPEYRAFQRKHG